MLIAATGSAFAQVGRYDPAEREAHKQQKQDAETAAKFPNAKRESPHLEATKKGGKGLNEIVEAYQSKNYADAIAKGEAFAAATDNAYEKSFPTSWRRPPRPTTRTTRAPLPTSRRPSRPTAWITTSITR